MRVQLPMKRPGYRLIAILLTGAAAACGSDDDGAAPLPATPTAVVLCGGSGDVAEDCPASPTPTKTCPVVATATPPPEPVPAVVAPGMLTFVNNCPVDLTLYTSPTLPTPPPPLAANGGQTSVSISTLNAGGSYFVIPYPNLSADQCPDCDDWTALDPAPPTPAAVQREGWMWLGTNAIFAAYCNPNLSGRGICALQNNCCGPGMVQDGTFGTRFEFSPNAFAGNDFVNLSTNFGTAPCDPPPLCGSAGADPNNCVAVGASIFFNVPVNWTTNSACSYTTRGTRVTGLQCVTVDCPDAYQYPTDDKQCACSSGSERGYVVQYCPARSSMPSPPG